MQQIDLINRRNLLGFIGALAYPLNAYAQTDLEKLIFAARAQTKNWVTYDPNYTKIPYPMGDVDKKYGVCTDVIIRAYRSIGIDLQKLVHEDMAANFSKYPKTWGLKSTDTNIDHRRVPNLMVYFSRFGQKLNISDNPQDYHAGDIITCLIGNRLPHIMLVSDKMSLFDNKRPLVIHNRGLGVQENDELFSFKLNGHYRFKV